MKPFKMSNVMNRALQILIATSLLFLVVGCAPPEPEGRVGAPPEPATTTTTPATTGSKEPAKGDEAPTTAQPPAIETGK